jgi:outer membrane protein OmpA-like peptidoglycan-associated protein
VSGQGVDEPFESTEGGLIALELYAGEYSATVKAEGYKDKSITFTVPEDGEAQLKEQLEPDKPPETPLIRASGKSIRLRKGIRYDGNDVAASSHEVLDQLATFLKFHPEYELVQIGVHTDDRGAAKKRSDERAEAVKSYLVSKGVSGSRVEAKGFGASRPVAVNMTAAGRAKNNRTVISVLKKK